MESPGIFETNEKQMEESFHELLEEIIAEADRQKTGYSITAISTLKSFKALKKKEESFLKSFLFYVATQVELRKNEFLNKRNRFSISIPWLASMKLCEQLLKTELVLTQEELSKLVNLLLKGIDDHYSSWVEIPFTAVLNRTAVLITENGVTELINEMLNSMIAKETAYSYAERRKANAKIYFLLQGDPQLGFNRHDRLGELLDKFIKSLSIEEKATWLDLFNTSITAAEKPAPSKKWLCETEKTIDKIGKSNFATLLIEWIIQVKEQIRDIHKDKTFSVGFLTNENHNLLRGLIWCAGFINDASLNNELDDYAGWAFKKKPSVGPISAKTGGACMYVFSVLPFKEGISRLTKFKLRIKNNIILKGIDKLIKEVAEKNGYSEELVMEIGIPDFGIINNELKMPIGGFDAIYTINDDTSGELTWQQNGKTQKAIPAAIKTGIPGELKKLKNIIKEIDELLPVQKMRIEQSYLKSKTWKYEDWFQNYFQHPLVSIIAKRLIWHFSNEEKKAQGIFFENNFQDQYGNTIDWLDLNATVQLWHPIGFSSDYINSWRNYIQEHKIIQPFKQAYREIYIVTDAEVNTNIYSNRFAAHILRQHQFAALCRQRGWQYHLMGAWDSHNTPIKRIDNWNITASYLVDAPWTQETIDSGIFTNIVTDQVYFTKDGERLTMADVPAMVFTEIMRDIDLFVGVTSIGNDTNWQDTGDNRTDTYWHDYSFGELTESAKVRQAVLMSLVPRFKIATQCSFDGKFLIVKGKIREYKIHMGSGNILMKPNDQYLCIVPGPTKEKKEKIYLPFEGDALLSIIISKAFLLAADHLIKDETITRQIKAN